MRICIVSPEYPPKLGGIGNYVRTLAKELENRGHHVMLIAPFANGRTLKDLKTSNVGVIRLGTVLGERMPAETAASIFIERGLKQQSLTPYKHSMYRPMLYIDIRDVLRAFESFADIILNAENEKGRNGLPRIVNVMYPEPVTILQLAEMVRGTIVELTNGRISPPIEIGDKGLPSLFCQDDGNKFEVDVGRAAQFLGLKRPISPKDSIRHVISKRLCTSVRTKPVTGMFSD